MGLRMNDPAESRSPSSSVGDYLKAIWELAADSGDAASTKEVAARLSVSAASVSNMFARLQEMGLVEHERYRGATLTERGKHEAGPAAGEAAQADRDLPSGAPRVRLAGGAQGGREVGARGVGRVHRPTRRVVGASGARPARGPHSLGRRNPG